MLTYITWRLLLTVVWPQPSTYRRPMCTKYLQGFLRIGLNKGVMIRLGKGMKMHVSVLRVLPRYVQSSLLHPPSWQFVSVILILGQPRSISMDMGTWPSPCTWELVEYSHHFSFWLLPVCVYVCVGGGGFRFDYSGSKEINAEIYIYVQYWFSKKFIALAELFLCWELLGYILSEICYSRRVFLWWVHLTE